ncbi:MAG: serine protein kinase PrkA [Myxococcota bacterium]|nr:serine protein kinase PrkA [Myxococcota bacterium]
MSRSDEPNESPNPTDRLGAELDGFKAEFRAKRILLSFKEYLEIFAEGPEQQVRDTARYVRDCFGHYGVEDIVRPYGHFTRFKLFDCPFDDGRDRLIGHEAAQEEVYAYLNDFSVHGRANRMILLHGPNGSAKSRFISCIMRALEDYSAQPEGAMYTFNWIFPSDTFEKGNIGFGDGPSLDDLANYAHLKDKDVDARLMNETRDHPILLLPRKQRLAFLRSYLGDDFPLPMAIADGELSPKARQIFDALLKAYQGDLNEVLKHVQVERIYVSRRYRRAAATVDPQMRVDAGVRQVTADRSLSSLPSSLQNLTLFEPLGDLVDANRGILEFNNLLKRPVEAFKYILATCETGAVRLDTMSLFLDALFLGSCNADHLTAFKQIPDFSSFKGRTELVQMPYLVDYNQETQIYWDILQTLDESLYIGPHVSDVVALWAVLCRLERPAGFGDDASELNDAIKKMTPIEKAHYYANGEVPADASREVGAHLRGLVESLYTERQAAEGYEGRFGPSPRELKALLLNAARHSEGILTGITVLGAIQELCEQTAVYPFLQLETDKAYHNPVHSVGVVRLWYLERVEDELNRAMGLVDQTAANSVVESYIDHVVHFIRKERRHNPVTGQSEPADAALMKNVEDKLKVEADSAPLYRESLVHRIAAWRMDHPEATLDYHVIFSDLMDKLNEAFYLEKQDTANRIKRNLLAYLTEEDPNLSPDERRDAEGIVSRFESDFGYPKPCAIEVIAFVLRARLPTKKQ